MREFIKLDLFLDPQICKLSHDDWLQLTILPQKYPSNLFSHLNNIYQTNEPT